MMTAVVNNVLEIHMALPRDLLRRLLRSCRHTSGASSNATSKPRAQRRRLSALAFALAQCGSGSVTGSDGKP